MIPDKEILEEFKAKMKEVCESGDTELRHIYADEVLCDLLEKLGYKEVVEIYNSVNKWYA